jgi:hypothetical protein
MPAVWEGPRLHLGEWQKRGASKEVLDWIQHGVKPVLQHEPKPYVCHSPVLVGKELEGWQKLKSEFLELGIIRPPLDGEVLTCVSKAFLIPKSNGEEFRAIVDLRPFNEDCVEIGCSYDTLYTLKDEVLKGDWMFSCDLAHGYYHLGIQDDCQHMFGFTINGEKWVMTALPMGWSQSPAMFTKFVGEIRKMLKHPRPVKCNGKVYRLGAPVRNRAYLDDLLFMCQNKRLAARQARYVRALLAVLGVKVSDTKSVWKPTQVLQHLGLEVDTKAGVFRVTAQRLGVVKDRIKLVLSVAARNARYVSARLVAKVAGSIQALALAKPDCRFYLRAVHDSLKTKAHWGAKVQLSHRAYRDLQHLSRTPAKEYEGPIWPLDPDFILAADASKSGWGAVLFDPGGQTQVAAGFWAPKWVDEHICVLEMMAVEKAIRAFKGLRDAVVLVQEDNVAAEYAVNKWSSPTVSIMQRVRVLFQLCRQRGLQVMAERVASADNPADVYSRLVDKEEWKLLPWVWQLLCKHWGVPVVDLFGREGVSQCDLYYSKYWDEGSLGADVLRVDPEQLRQHGLLYANPPWSLLPVFVPWCIQHHLPVVIVAPYWPEQLWCRLLVKFFDVVVLPKGSAVFQSCQSHRSFKTRWPVLLCRSRQ